MAVRTKGGRHTVEFMFRGARVFRRLPAGRTKAEAHALEAKLRSDLFNSVDLGKLPDPPLVSVIREWAKGKDAKAQSHINAVLAHTPETCTLSQAAGLRDRLVSDWASLAPGTINRRLSVLKGAAKMAFRRKWTKTNLSAEIELLPEPRYLRREVSPEMAQILIRNASTARAKALIAAAAYTGMRLSEVLRIDPADIQDGAFKVLGKNGEVRFVPVPEELKPHLKQFPIKAGWRNVYRGFERARKKAGLTLRFHDLRHMAGTAMANADVNQRLIADIMGHKSTQTTHRYTHPSIEAKRRALGAITAGLQQGKAKRAKK
jgi:integrase